MKIYKSNQTSQPCEMNMSENIPSKNINNSNSNVLSSLLSKNKNASHSKNHSQQGICYSKSPINDNINRCGSQSLFNRKNITQQEKIENDKNNNNYYDTLLRDYSNNKDIYEKLFSNKSHSLSNLENIYLKYTKDLKNYYSKNKEGMQVTGNKKFENLPIDLFLSESKKYNEDLIKQITINKNRIKPYIPNENDAKDIKMELTPLPNKSYLLMKTNKEKNDYTNAERCAVSLRQLEYTHALKNKNSAKQRQHSNTARYDNQNCNYNENNNDLNINQEELFYILKRAVNTIENWWFKIKKKNKFHSYNRSCCLATASHSGNLNNMNYINSKGSNNNSNRIINDFLYDDSNNNKYRKISNNKKNNHNSYLVNSNNNGKYSSSFSGIIDKNNIRNQYQKNLNLFKQNNNKKNDKNSFHKKGSNHSIVKKSDISISLKYLADKVFENVNDRYKKSRKYFNSYFYNILKEQYMRKKEDYNIVKENNIDILNTRMGENINSKKEEDTGINMGLKTDINANDYYNNYTNYRKKYSDLYDVDNLHYNYDTNFDLNPNTKYNYYSVYNFNYDYISNPVVSRSSNPYQSNNLSSNVTSINIPNYNNSNNMNKKIYEPVKNYLIPDLTSLKITSASHQFLKNQNTHDDKNIVDTYSIPNKNVPINNQKDLIRNKVKDDINTNNMNTHIVKFYPIKNEISFTINPLLGYMKIFKPEKLISKKYDDFILNKRVRPNLQMQLANQQDVFGIYENKLLLNMNKINKKIFYSNKYHYSTKKIYIKNEILINNIVKLQSITRGHSYRKQFKKERLNQICKRLIFYYNKNYQLNKRRSISLLFNKWQYINKNSDSKILLNINRKNIFYFFLYTSFKQIDNKLLKYSLEKIKKNNKEVIRYRKMYRSLKKLCLKKTRKDNNFSINIHFIIWLDKVKQIKSFMNTLILKTTSLQKKLFLYKLLYLLYDEFHLNSENRSINKNYQENIKDKSTQFPSREDLLIEHLVNIKNKINEYSFYNLIKMYLFKLNFDVNDVDEEAFNFLYSGEINKYNKLLIRILTLNNPAKYKNKKIKFSQFLTHFKKIINYKKLINQADSFYIQSNVKEKSNNEFVINMNEHQIEKTENLEIANSPKKIKDNTKNSNKYLIETIDLSNINIKSKNKNKNPKDKRTDTDNICTSLEKNDKKPLDPIEPNNDNSLNETNRQFTSLKKSYISSGSEDESKCDKPNSISINNINNSNNANNTGNISKFLEKSQLNKSKNDDKVKSKNINEISMSDNEELIDNLDDSDVRSFGERVDDDEDNKNNLGKTKCAGKNNDIKEYQPSLINTFNIVGIHKKEGDDDDVTGDDGKKNNSQFLNKTSHLCSNGRRLLYASKKNYQNKDKDYIELRQSDAEHVYFG